MLATESALVNATGVPGTYYILGLALYNRFESAPRGVMLGALRAYTRFLGPSPRQRAEAYFLQGSIFFKKRAPSGTPAADPSPHRSARRRRDVSPKMATLRRDPAPRRSASACPENLIKIDPSACPEKPLGSRSEAYFPPRVILHRVGAIQAALPTYIVKAPGSRGLRSDGPCWHGLP